MNGTLGCAAALAASLVLLRQVSVPFRLRGPLLILGALGSLSASTSISMFSGAPQRWVDAALFVIALVLLLVAPARGQEATDHSLHHQDKWMSRGFLLAAVMVAAALLSHLRRYSDGGNDAFIIWNLRARWLYRAGEGFRSAFSPDILFWSHADYPLLLPTILVRGFTVLGREDQTIPALMACLFTACCVWVVFGGAPARLRWLFGLAILTTPALVMQGATEQADVPLAAFLGAATAVLITRRPGDLRALVAAGVFASMAAWTKNEGSLHFLLLMLAVLLDERRLVAGAAFLLGALPFLALLLIFRTSYSPGNDLLQTSLVAAAGHALDLFRWRTLLYLVARRLVLLQAWGLHLLALIAWIALGRRRTSPPPHLRWLSWVPAGVMVVHAGILLGQPHDLGFMFKVTIDRLLIQIWPMILLLIACRFNPGQGRQSPEGGESLPALAHAAA